MIYSRFFKNEVKSLVSDLFTKVEATDTIVEKLYCNKKIFKLLKDDISICEGSYFFWGAELVITEDKKIKVLNFLGENYQELEYNFKVAILKKIELILRKIFCKKYKK